MNGTHIPTAPLGLTGDWNHAGPGDWAEVLGGFPLFAGIAKRRLRGLARQATLAEYSPGDIVIQKGEPGDSLYVILGGSAKARGKPAARTLRTGDYFGELGLLDSVPRSATVVATGELHVMKLPRRAFLRVARHEPSISLELASRLGSQVRRLEAQAA
jgi:CRP-like cAMP-binding protein